MVTPENPKTLCTPRSMRLFARISALFIIVPRSVSPPYQRKSMSTGRSNSFLILSAHFFIRWPRSRCFQSIFTRSQVPRLTACMFISHIQPSPLFPQPFLPGAPVQRTTPFRPVRLGRLSSRTRTICLPVLDGTVAAVPFSSVEVMRGKGCRGGVIFTFLNLKNIMLHNFESKNP